MIYYLTWCPIPGRSIIVSNRKVKETRPIIDCILLSNKNFNLNMKSGKERQTIVNQIWSRWNNLILGDIDCQRTCI